MDRTVTKVSFLCVLSVVALESRIGKNLQFVVFSSNVCTQVVKGSGNVVFYFMVLTKIKQNISFIMRPKAKRKKYEQTLREYPENVFNDGGRGD